jgi:hypothetical protein
MRLFSLIPALFLCLVLVSCPDKNAGWGVLLWSTADPPMSSGTVLRVRIRSSIEQAWVVLVPEEYRAAEEPLAMVPLPHLEFFRTRGGAEKFAASFAEYAAVYAEILQDGLPIRDKPENNARRVYRLKQREIIKILEKAPGVEAISASGSPLEGDWYRVLTESGSTGFCFSYRMRLFEHGPGPVGDAPVEADTSGDRELELVLSRVWYPQSYGTMINSGRINLDALSQNYSFTSGIASGRARIHLEGGDAEFPYRKITKTGDRTWSFDGSSLTVSLRSESVLEARWEEEGVERSETFITLPVSVENIVNQEKERRRNTFQALYTRGPSFTSANYGTLVLAEPGNFTWDGIASLPEGILPASTLGSGTLDLDYYLSGDMAGRYTGAMALRLNSAGGSPDRLVFAYTLDNQGLRMEYIPADYVSGRTVARRAPSPLVIYFSPES